MRARHAVLATLLLAALASPATAGVPGAPHQLVVSVDRPAVIRYTVQVPGKPPREVAEPQPVNEKLIVVNRNRDGRLPQITVHAEARGNPFTHYEKEWTGRSRELHYEGTNGLDADRLQLTLDAVVDWGRIAAFLAGLGAVVGLVMLRQRRSYARRLEAADTTLSNIRERLTQAQLQTGLFPADGSNPRTIGPYDVVSRLGAGAMAVVYRVRNDAGEEFALKLPMPSCLQNEAFKQRFRRELKFGVRLMHPNLVRIMDVNGGEEGEAYPYPFLVMELVKGKTLEEIEPPSVSSAVAIAAQILDALAYVHENGVIHRDVKPSNIMITASGRARLMDFGVAHRQDTHLGRLTGTNEVLGTPVYMAPEQIAGQGVDVRADLYALGILLYEVLAGGLPYGDDMMQIITSKMSEELPPLSAVRSDVPPALVGWVARMVAREPQRRYATAAEARAALAEVTAAIPADA